MGLGAARVFSTIVEVQSRGIAQAEQRVTRFTGSLKHLSGAEAELKKKRIAASSLALGRERSVHRVEELTKAYAAATAEYKSRNAVSFHDQDKYTAAWKRYKSRYERENKKQTASKIDFLDSDEYKKALASWINQAAIAKKRIGDKLSEANFSLDLQEEFLVARSEMADLEEATENVSRALQFGGGVLLAVGTAMLVVAGSAAKLTADLQQVEMVSQAVSRSSSSNRVAITQLLETTDNEMVSRTELLRTMTNLMGVRADFVDFAKLEAASMDIAAAKGEDYDDVLRNLTTAIANRSVASLRGLTISASAENIFERQAEALHKNVTVLSDAEERQAVYNYIIQTATTFSGAYAAAQATLATQTNRFKIQLKEVGADLGKTIVPMLSLATQKAGDLLQEFRQLPAGVKSTIGYTVGLTGSVLALSGGLTVLGPVIKIVQQSLAKLGPLMNTKFLTGAGIAAAVIFVLGKIVEAMIKAEEQAIKTRSPYKELNAQYNDMDRQAKLAAAATELFYESQDLNAVVSATKAIERMQFQLERLSYSASAAQRALDLAMRTLDRPIQEANFDLRLQFSSNYYWEQKKYDRATKAITASSKQADKEISDLNKSMQELDKSSGDYEHQAYALSQAMFAAQMYTRGLDAALVGVNNTLRRIEASATFILIPLERQKRALEAQLAKIEEISEAEIKKQEKLIKDLEDQKKAVDELLQKDRDRLDLIDHELFIEEHRNTILNRASSIRELQLRTERKEQEALIDQRENESKSYDDRIDAEQEKLEILQESAEKQSEAIQKQIAAIDKMVAAEQERITFAREEIELAEARQVEERIAAEARQQALETQNMILSNQQEIINHQKEQEKDRIQVQLDALTAQKERLDSLQDTLNTMHEKAMQPYEDAKELLEDLKMLQEEDRIEIEKKQTAVGDLLDKYQWIASTLGNINSVYQKTNTELEKRVSLLEETVTLLSSQSVNTGAPESAVANVFDRYAKDIAVIKEFFNNLYSYVPGPFGTIPRLLTGSKLTFDENFFNSFIDVFIGDFNSSYDLKKLFNSIFKPEEAKADMLQKLTPTASETETVAKAYIPHSFGRFVPGEEGRNDIIGSYKIIQEEDIAQRNIFLAQQEEGRLLFEDSLFEWLETFVTTLIENFLEQFTVISTTVKESFDTLTNWFRKGQEGFLKAITAAREWGRGIRDEVVAFFKLEETIKKFKSIGDGIIEGIKQGVIERWEAFKRWIEAQFNTLPEWMKKVLKISSPSKVMIPIGKEIVSGIELGMEKQFDKFPDRLKNVVETRIPPVGLVTKQAEEKLKIEIEPLKEILRRQLTEMTPEQSAGIPFWSGYFKKFLGSFSDRESYPVTIWSALQEFMQSHEQVRDINGSMNRTPANTTNYYRMLRDYVVTVNASYGNTVSPVALERDLRMALALL